MKKSLLIWAVIFHAIMYSVALWYVGYHFGKNALLPSSRPAEFFIFVVVELILLVISIFLVREREYAECKHYCRLGTVTLVYGCWKLGSRLYFHSQGRMVEDPVDIYIYPILVFCLSLIISIIYFVCAVKTLPESSEI